MKRRCEDSAVSSDSGCLSLQQKLVTIHAADVATELFFRTSYVVVRTPESSRQGLSSFLKA